MAGNGTRGYSGDGGPATAAEFADPAGVASDGAGNLVIADVGTDRVRVVAGQTGTFYGKAMKAGDVYAIAGNGHPGRPVLGRIATATPAGLLGVAVDAAGNMLFADLQANRILVVPVGTGTFYGQAMIAGHVYDIAGTGSRGHHGEDGPATGATLAGPQSVTVDAAGNVLIADTHNQRVRVVAGQTGTFYGVPMTAGDIDTVAGTGVAEFSGNGGPATSADIGEPGGIMVSPAGDLIFCDAYNDQIREVAG